MIVLHEGDRLAVADVDGIQYRAIFDATEAHRYVLSRHWNESLKPLVVIGLNPSTATELVDDPTIRRCMTFARDWEYGGLVMLNLFSFRSTDPKALDYKNRSAGAVWPGSVTGGEANNDYLKFYTDHRGAGAVLAAWGNHGWIAGRGEIVEAMLRAEGVQLTALGVTKQFRPTHPLYVPRSTKPTAYRFSLARLGMTA